MAAYGYCPSDDEMKAEIDALSPEDRATLEALPQPEDDLFTLTAPAPLPAVAPHIPKADARRLPYSGPFPRKRHYHRCPKCASHGSNGVNCYKQHCTKPVLMDVPCGWCR